MKKLFIYSFLMFFGLNIVANATTIQPGNNDVKPLDNIEETLRGDFRIFLDELNAEKERGKKESEIIKNDMKEILQETKNLIEESRKELKEISYSENRNLLVASIFLWISITIFIIMNLIFANNLKKELYFLRNGLLRSEIKESMINLSNQLYDLNERLKLMNKE